MENQKLECFSCIHFLVLVLVCLLQVAQGIWIFHEAKRGPWHALLALAVGHPFMFGNYNIQCTKFIKLKIKPK